MINDNGLIGRVVLARAGRDKGKIFVVVGQLDHEYVLIANGTNRSVEKPKKKKLKHVELRPEYLDNIREKLLKGQMILDAEIRKSLESLGILENG
ncbi:MAG: RNA-binding protein [Clostridiales bacterium]|jgi:large subunit ribosomal protein L14e|nr:RNA-binding protein [Clostridiales bacterium]